jgi:prophage tail gpP-like protein
VFYGTARASGVVLAREFDGELVLGQPAVRVRPAALCVHR